MNRNTILPAALCIALGLNVLALAQIASVETSSARINASVPYAAGGVGLQERLQIESRAGAYNLRIMFAEGDGAYVVPDTVVVKREGKEIFTAAGGGPLIFLNVPPGVYRVQAHYNGIARNRDVRVGANAPSVVMVWPTERSEPPMTPRGDNKSVR